MTTLESTQEQRWSFLPPPQFFFATHKTILTRVLGYVFLVENSIEFWRSLLELFSPSYWYLIHKVGLANNAWRFESRCDWCMNVYVGCHPKLHTHNWAPSSVVAEEAIGNNPSSLGSVSTLIKWIIFFSKINKNKIFFTVWNYILFSIIYYIILW
jgi:hypothetical protein